MIAEAHVKATWSTIVWSHVDLSKKLACSRPGMTRESTLLSKRYLCTLGLSTRLSFSDKNTDKGRFVVVVLDRLETGLGGREVQAGCTKCAV
jgi:hypothetical protein